MKVLAARPGFWLFVALLCTVTRASAVDGPDDRDRAIPCRPTISCSADIEAPGIFEIEAGPQYAHGATSATTTPVLLKQSLATWLQLQAGTNGYTLLQGNVNAQYLANIFVGPKLHLFDQGVSAPALAISAEAGLPVNPTHGFVRTYDLLFIGYLSKDFGRLHADFNAGLDIGNLPRPASVQYYLALALSTALADHVGMSLEAYFFYNSSLAADDGGVRLAFTFPLRSWLVLDCGGDVGFFQAQRSFTVFGGITVIPVVFWRPPPPS
jgi:hypothetical protein